MGRVLTVAVIVCALGVPVLAAQAPQAYQDGTDALYSLDFSKAESAFTGLTKQYPDDPDYWNALASVVWLKILYDQQKLNMESFSGKDRFGTADSKDAVALADETRLRGTLEQAIARGEALRKKNPNDIRALYALGVSNATLASFEGTVKRSYRAAANKAKAAKEFHTRILKMDPGYHDARMAVGIYNYVVGSLPGRAKPLVWTIGIKGDGKTAGIRDLEKAAADGKRAAIDAKMLLVVVYNREQQYDRSLKILSELRSKYPRNFMFEMSTASVYGKMRRWDLAIDTYNRIVEKVAAKRDGYERMRLERVLYELGDSQFQSSRFNDANATFAKVVAGANASPNEKASAHMWMGKMADTSGRRPDAVNHYRAIRELDCNDDLKAEAKKYEKRPFGG